MLKTSTHTSTLTPTPASSQSTARPLTSELEAYAAGRARKRQATTGLEDRPSPPDPKYLGTPRSIRLKNVFTGAMAPPNLLDVARKLNNLVESNIKLPKKGAEKTSIGSETAADIKTLTIRLLELDEFHNDIPTIRRNLFSNEDEEHQVERALAGANTFGCKVPDIIEANLEKLTKSIERIERATTAPSSNFSFRTSKSNNPTTPSYALAASKHNPQTITHSRATTFKPVLTRKAPPAPPSSLKLLNTVTLTQSIKGGLELAGLNYPTLIANINAKLSEAKIKVNHLDERPIQVRSVHRHPSNDLVLYTTTALQAEALRAQGDDWIPGISSNLTIQNPVHTNLLQTIRPSPP